MRRFRVVGVRVGLDAVEQAEGVFGIVVLPKKPKKPKKLLKLERRSGTLGESGKVGFGVPSVQKGLYPGKGIVDTFKERI